MTSSSKAHGPLRSLLIIASSMVSMASDLRLKCVMPALLIEMCALGARKDPSLVWCNGMTSGGRQRAVSGGGTSGDVAAVAVPVIYGVIRSINRGFVSRYRLIGTYYLFPALAAIILACPIPIITLCDMPSFLAQMLTR